MSFVMVSHIKICFLELGKGCDILLETYRLLLTGSNPASSGQDKLIMKI